VHVKLNRPWLVWQVMVPLVGPVALSWLIILAWQTGNPDFTPRWSVILDVSPWALTFYAIALIGAALNELWPTISVHPHLGGGLIFIATTVATYTAFMVIWRHNSAFVPSRNIYIPSVFMLLITVALCHSVHSKRGRIQDVSACNKRTRIDDGKRRLPGACRCSHGLSVRTRRRGSTHHWGNRGRHRRRAARVELAKYHQKRRSGTAGDAASELMHRSHQGTVSYISKRADPGATP
jgi:hypothetical protein